MDDCPNIGLTSPSLAPNPPPNPPLPDVAAPNEALFDADAPNPDDGVDCKFDSPEEEIGLDVVSDPFEATFGSSIVSTTSGLLTVSWHATGNSMRNSVPGEQP